MTPGPCHFIRGRQSQEVWKLREEGCEEVKWEGARLILLFEGQRGVWWGSDRNAVTYFILEPPSAGQGRTLRGAGCNPDFLPRSIAPGPARRPPHSLHSPSSSACSRSGAETTSSRVRRPRGAAPASAQPPRAPATMAPPGASLAGSASARRAQRRRCPGRAASSAAERGAGTGRSCSPAPNPIEATRGAARWGRLPPRPAPRSGPERRKSRSPAATVLQAGGVPGAPYFTLPFSFAPPPPVHVNLGAWRTPGLETCPSPSHTVWPEVPERAMGVPKRCGLASDSSLEGLEML